MNAFLIAIQAAALFYLGSRAVITSWLWSRYPPWLDKLTSCAACSGFWYGIGLAAVEGYTQRLSYLGLDLTSPWTWPLVGLASITTTPVAAYFLQLYLDQLGTPKAE